ncbi:MAG: GGDEF domain-containing protein [Treponema sp.]|nr:GGDEF domain-containing protein [Treponema sp.]
MSRKKKIGLVTINPENDYQQRVISAIISQCKLYNYDVLVFTPMVNASTSKVFNDYFEGELNIYEMINFDLLDGVIVTPLPMTDDRITCITDKLQKIFKERCNIPVVSIDMKFDDYPVVETDDESPFYHITHHLIKQHNCKKLVMLTGMKNFPISEKRVAGFAKAMEENGLKLSSDTIVYGDFWYTSGEALAQKIIAQKENKRPDAVICASDHMAIGLTNSLIKNGIKVPEDIIVTGYEAIHEAVMNNPPITSYAADQVFTAKSAVNLLHSKIDPKGIEYKPERAGIKNLCIGRTCGCQEDVNYTYEKIKGSQYSVNHEFFDDKARNHSDIGTLLESYMNEILTATSTPYECLGKIYESIYLLKPYVNFWLCLNENWLDNEKDQKIGYNSKMSQVIFSDMEKKLHGYDNHVFIGKDREKLFETKEMLPALKEDEFDTTQVFYFVPVHFNSACLGYAVLQQKAENPRVIDVFYKNYIRNINNALEMIRTKHKIAMYSEHDIMTGLYNRRGMARLAAEKLAASKKSDKWLAIVIDMDGLKIRNDSYGHSEGDAGIVAIAQAVKGITDKNEICVRGGGDEFFLLGLGSYTEKAAVAKVEKFNQLINKINENIKLPVSASIGYAIASAKNVSYEEVLEDADVKMYLDKRSKKRMRR